MRSDGHSAGASDDEAGDGYFAAVEPVGACGDGGVGRAALKHNPFMHTWSLDVEEQFSVVRPPAREPERAEGRSPPPPGGTLRNRGSAVE